MQVKRMKAAAQAHLQVAQHRVYPLELGQVPGLACAHHCGLMGAAQLGHRGKAGQPVGVHRRADVYILAGPLLYGGRAESGHRRELDVARPTLLKRERSHKGLLVLRAPACLASWQLPAQIGIIDLDVSVQRIECVALGHHGGHELVVQQPGGGVAHPKLACQRQRRDAALGLPDQIHSQRTTGSVAA